MPVTEFIGWSYQHHCEVRRRHLLPSGWRSLWPWAIGTARPPVPVCSDPLAPGGPVLGLSPATTATTLTYGTCTTATAYLLTNRSHLLTQKHHHPSKRPFPYLDPNYDHGFLRRR